MYISSRMRASQVGSTHTPYMRVPQHFTPVTGGKKKKPKKVKPNKTQTLNDFLADVSTGSKYAKDPPKRTGSWADAMEERLDAEGGTM